MKLHCDQMMMVAQDGNSTPKQNMTRLFIVTIAFLIDGAACFVCEFSRRDGNSFFDGVGTATTTTSTSGCNKAALDSLFVGVLPPTSSVSKALRMTSDQNSGIASSHTGEDAVEDTIRVRIWRALASGEELSLPSCDCGRTEGYKITSCAC